jgi:hypothetical protein
MHFFTEGEKYIKAESLTRFIHWIVMPTKMMVEKMPNTSIWKKLGCGAVIFPLLPYTILSLLSVTVCLLFCAVLSAVCKAVYGKL